MTPPLVSCLLPTYNRFPAFGHLVEEAVESFLRQDHPHRELLICNDTPEQFIRFDDPRVRIFNLFQRMPTLSAKIQFLIDRAAGDVFCRWDDDDISLPHRLSYSLARLGERLEWRPDNYWYCPRGGRPEQVHGAGNTHVMAVWRREVLARIGGCYPAGLSGSEDQTFNRLLAEAGLAPCGAPIPTADMFYLYRWGVSDRHLSGVGGGAPANPHQGHYDAIGSRPILAGEFHIRPHWRGNYAWPDGAVSGLA